MKTNKSLFFLLVFLGGTVIANGIEASNPKESHPPRQSPAQAVATNGFYDVIVEDVFGSSGIGTYTVRTGQNHPITIQHGQKQDILYGGAAGSPWSTYLTVRSYDSHNEYVSTSSNPSASPGFTVYRLESVSNPPPTVSPIGSTGFKTTWNIPGGSYVDLLKIEQVTIIEGTTVDDSRIRVSTIVTNLGTSNPANIGIRYEWDIMIDGYDGSWFAPRLPDSPFTDVETEWSPPPFQHYETTNNPNDPVFRILGSVNGPVFFPSVTPPDVLQFVAWGSSPSPGLYHYAFDFTPSGRIIAGYGKDSAIGYFWGRTLGQALVIPPGGSTMVTQYLYLREPHYLDLSTTAPIPTQVYEGGHLCFDVIVEDSDPSHMLLVNAENVPSFATWTNASGTTPLIKPFCVDPGYDDAGNYLVRFIATDGILVDTQEVNIEVININRPPICQLFCPQQVNQGASVDINFTVSDPEGDFIKSVVPSVDFGSVGSAIPNSGYPPFNGTFTFTAPDDPFVGFVHTTLTVTDTCDAEDVCKCSVEVVVAPPVANQVKIPNRVYERFGYGHWIEGQDSILVDDFCYPFQGINPGGFFEIPIVLEDFSPQHPIGAFELEVDFDYVDLTFYGAERGILLTHRESVEDTLYTWEYFSYRVLPCPTCACCKYRILLYGQAEMPDGLFRRGYCLNPTNDFPETYWAIDQAKYYHNGQMEMVDIGATLVWLKFQVANNELLRDLKLPIVFEWEHKLGGQYPNYYIIQDWDCVENTMSSCDGVDLYVSKNPMQYEPDVCGLSQPGGGAIYTILDFVDGGVHICSPCTAFKCVRGDINLNHVAYEPADAVLFARALVFGPTTVFWYVPVQTCATDINADGRTLMLSDLIYLIRVIQDDAVPFGKLGPSSDVANLIISDGRITVECASAIGGLLFEFDGVVTPTLLNNNMEIIAGENKVLVWSQKGNSINAGSSEVLTFAGAKPTSVIAVDREGRELATTITTKVVPSTFALNAAYPNPFNPFTNLSFTLPNAMAYSLKIYNVAGQLVRSYEGMGTAGLNVMTWDGKNNGGDEVGSGIYFYKLVAGKYSAIKKMVVLK